MEPAMPQPIKKAQVQQTPVPVQKAVAQPAQVKLKMPTPVQPSTPTQNSGVQPLPVQKPVTGTGNEGVPMLVKVISVLYYISAALTVIGGIIAFTHNDIDIINRIIMLVIALGIGVLCFFIGRGLWKGKNWARITASVIAILDALTFIAMYVMTSVFLNLVSGIIPSAGIGKIVIIFFTLLNLAIAGYLLFSKKVKEVFKKTTAPVQKA